MYSGFFHFNLYFSSLISTVERPNRRRYQATGCPGAATLQIKDGCILVSKHTPCDNSHSSSTHVVAAMPKGDDLQELVAQNTWDGVSFHCVTRLVVGCS
jgi:hypothetical protein